jgi:hypothetical protein
MAPSTGLAATNAASTSGNWTICQPLSNLCTRITAPRRTRLFGADLSSSMRAANLSPSSLILSTSPPRR